MTPSRPWLTAPGRTLNARPASAVAAATGLERWPLKRNPVAVAGPHGPVGGLSFADAETLLAATRPMAGDDMRLKPALAVTIDTRGIAVPRESGGYRPSPYVARPSSVSRTPSSFRRKAPTSWLSARFEKSVEPGLTSIGHGLPIRQHPSVMGFKRDVLALDVLSGRRGARQTPGVGYDLDDRRLIAAGELPRASDGIAPALPHSRRRRALLRLRSGSACRSTAPPPAARRLRRRLSESNACAPRRPAPRS